MVIESISIYQQHLSTSKAHGLRPANRKHQHSRGLRISNASRNGRYVWHKERGTIFARWLNDLIVSILRIIAENITA